MERKKSSEAKVEIMGIDVSQALIDSVVKATSDPSDPSDEVEERERARIRKIISDSELRADIDVSKQITSALIEQAGKPEALRVSIDCLPPELRRVVIAYMNLREAREEYDAAVMALQKPVNPEQVAHPLS